MRVTRKIFNRAGANLFFWLIFQRYSFFFFSLFCSFWFLFFFCLLVSLFVCCFLKLKVCILMHIRLCRRVSDKNFFTRPISGNKTTFFDTLSLSCHEQVCLSGPLKHTCSWHDKLIVLWILNRQAKISLCILFLIWSTLHKKNKIFH